MWCASCRLTRGRPDTGNPDAVDAWSRAWVGRVRPPLERRRRRLQVPFGRAARQVRRRSGPQMTTKTATSGSSRPRAIDAAGPSGRRHSSFRAVLRRHWRLRWAHVRGESPRLGGWPMTLSPRAARRLCGPGCICSTRTRSCTSSSRSRTLMMALLFAASAVTGRRLIVRFARGFCVRHRRGPSPGDRRPVRPAHVPVGRRAGPSP